MINTTSMAFMDAEMACQDSGGHLVSYSSFEEQQEVEAAFIQSGVWLRPRLAAHGFLRTCRLPTP